MSEAGRIFPDDKCASKLKNLKRTWTASRRPGATKRNWEFMDTMDEIFENDPTATLENVAEVNDGGPKVLIFIHCAQFNINN